MKASCVEIKTVHKQKNLGVIYGSMIPNGEIFTGVIANCANRLFVKLENIIYPLDREVYSVTARWTEPCIRSYKPVRSLTVTVETD